MATSPCVVVLRSREGASGVRRVVVCPITHELPDSRSTAVEIPPRVARHLGLDDDQMWIKTHQVNTFEIWPNQIPFGVTPARADTWIFGELPHGLGRRVFEQVRDNIKRRTLRLVDRDREG